MTVTRGTSNSDVRGSSYQRKARREYLVQTYRADVDAAVSKLPTRDLLGEWDPEIRTAFGHTREPACRCYRCGTLLTVDTVTVDRIIPGCLGGTYARNNIRPACADCNTRTGAAMANSKALAPAKKAARKRAAKRAAA